LIAAIREIVEKERAAVSLPEPKDFHGWRNQP